MFVGGSIELASFAALFFAFRRLRSVFDMLRYTIPKYYSDSMIFSKTLEFLYLKNNVKSPARPISIPEAGTLAVDNIMFRYQSRKEAVLNNLNLRIRPGEKVAIVGYNGAGKSTLVHLLLRLYDVESGNIQYGGRDIRNFDLKNYRSLFGCMFQGHNLYALPLLENVSMNVYEQSDAQRVMHALQFSDTDGELWRKLGDLKRCVTREFDNDGIYLSGGETQKLALARIFYRDYPILVLDELSSKLDPISESYLHNMLFSIQGKTVIIISHRLSATRMADRIFFTPAGAFKVKIPIEEIIGKVDTFVYAEVTGEVNKYDAVMPMDKE